MLNAPNYPTRLIRKGASCAKKESKFNERREKLVNILEIETLNRINKSNDILKK